MVPSPTTTVAARCGGCPRGAGRCALRAVDSTMPTSPASTTTATSARDPGEPQRARDARDEQHGSPTRTAAPATGRPAAASTTPTALATTSDESRPPERDARLRGHERGVGDDHRGERQEQARAPTGGAGGPSASDEDARCERDEPAGGAPRRRPRGRRRPPSRSTRRATPRPTCPSTSCSPTDSPQPTIEPDGRLPTARRDGPRRTRPPGSAPRRPPRR